MLVQRYQQNNVVNNYLTEALLVKLVLKTEKSNFLKYSVSPVNTGDGVVLP